MVSLLLIIKNNEFLLLKRGSNENKYPNFYGLPGGKVEENETPIEAVIREIKEELGLDIPNVNILKKYPNICVYYYNSSEFDETKIKLNEEHTEYSFFSYYEILQIKNIIPSTIGFINEYLKN